MCTAVIHHEIIVNRGVLISSAIDGQEGKSTFHPLSSHDDYKVKVADEFMHLWKNTGTEPMTAYISEPTIRSLLNEQKETHFPTLQLRSLIAGTALTTTWKACRQAHAEQITTLAQKHTSEPIKKGRVTNMVVATDASRQQNCPTTGISAVSTTGAVRMDTVKSTSIADGEYAAVTMALRHWEDKAASFDILTDSRAVYQKINYSTQPSSATGHAAECLGLVANLKAKGVPVRVHWIRGHNGHILNALADRAAVSARRCTQWDLTSMMHEFSGRLREELNQSLETLTVDDVLPAAPGRDFYMAQSYMENAAA